MLFRLLKSCFMNFQLLHWSIHVDEVGDHCLLKIAGGEGFSNGNKVAKVNQIREDGISY